jgi:superfamily II DNA helicase RecQ
VGVVVSSVVVVVVSGAVVVVVVVVVVKRKDVFERGNNTQNGSLLSVIGTSMAGSVQSYSLRVLGSGFKSALRNTTTMPTTTPTKNRYLVVHYDWPEDSLADRNLSQYDNIVRAVNERLENVGKHWKIMPWQAAAAAEMLERRDIVVKAQTGSGKSMCYLALAITYPEDCIIVICPLLALMTDQVQSASVYGVKAVELSAATIRDDPQLLRKVRDGEFSMVLVSAEFTMTEAWKTLLKEDRPRDATSFAQSLRRIIIDEAHLVREW